MASFWDSSASGGFGNYGDQLGRNIDPGELFWDPTRASELERKKQLLGQAGSAGGFADQAQQNFGGLGQAATQQQDYLRQLASGQHSVSAMQLQQGLQQNLAAQQSLAAGASPQNSAMAARTAAIQSARLGGGLSGQQALAGLQEQQQANQSLNALIMQQRQQELQAALQSRQTAVQGYSAQNNQELKSNLDKIGPVAGGIFKAMAGGMAPGAGGAGAAGGA